jgi:hypothetical protein
MWLQTNAGMAPVMKKLHRMGITFAIIVSTTLASSILFAKLVADDGGGSPDDSDSDDVYDENGVEK